MKLALSDVDQALSTSLPIAFLQVLELGAFDEAIFPSSFSSSTFFESIVFSAFLVCDGHCNLVSTDDL